MADGDSVKRALLNFMMKETFAFTQNCNEDSSTLGETTTTIGSGSATNLTETEASVESRSTLPSRRKESGRLLRQNSVVRSLVRPTMAGFLIVALLPLLLERMCEWRQIRRHGPLGDGDSTLTVKLPEMPLGQDAECLLSGNVKDCSCQFSQVDALNEEIVRPKLNKIVNKRFFSYFKVDLHCACPFWPEDGMCNMPACSVCECSEDEVPGSWGILECAQLRKTGEAGEAEGKAFSEKLESRVDRSVEKGVGGEEGMKWQASDNPWLYNEGKEISQPQDSFVYVDLHLNPERFTGYSGEHANRIWKAIYSQSCFEGMSEKELVEVSHGVFPGMTLTKLSSHMVCKEKQVFFRLISGLHTSITAHIAAEHPREVCFGESTGARQVSNLQSTAHPLSGEGPAAASSYKGFGNAPGNFDPFAVEKGGCTLDEKHWGPNLKLFYARLGKREFKSRIENLYFTYLFTLQAAVRAAPYLVDTEYYTGHADDDLVTKMLVRSLLQNDRLRSMCTKAFDEGMLWRSPGAGLGRKEASRDTKGDRESFNLLQEEMQGHFQNISKIMDCVGCEKCKLWGKLQIIGLGTALKILFSVDDIGQLTLTRNEVIALFNLVSRLSESVHTVGQLLCTLISQGYTDVVVPSLCRVLQAP